MTSGAIYELAAVEIKRLLPTVPAEPSINDVRRCKEPTTYRTSDRVLWPRYDLDPRRVRYTFDPDQISALVARRIDELLKRKSIGVESDNEIRRLMGLEAYEGGNVILKSASLIPAGTDVDIDDPLTGADESFDI